ncbi:amino acid ABC transporter substrate-binding protein [Rhizobium leguminosarum bv. trifolii]|uniref:transporter substrate-binding domain-containing protein n=1 Tax=Rhizobium leguminosarum TaxID=384 RepID=UPI000E2F2CFC|nr:transporter substrate-binding domain-containing protein [Rhizobium leguminosarum]RFB86089.1 amino acid ABC transporter substrate-binding protein [Rhizobium leguminosarum bv. trifolii]
MNKILTTIASVASFASIVFSTSVHAGEVLDRVLAKKTLTVATDIEFRPASFLNEKHELDGYDVEVAKGIAKYLGVDVKFVTPGWDVITAGKWGDRWEIAMGQMNPTAARAEKFDFAAVYVYAYAIAAVHKDNKSTQLSDLDGKVVGASTGTTSESYANHKLTLIGAPPIEYKFTPGKVVSYQSETTAFDDLRLGDGVRVDGVIASLPTLKKAIEAGYPIKQLDDVLFSSPGTIPILHGDKEFGEKIAAAVKSMKDDGTLSKLSMKWYGVDYTIAK